ncbi:hypothetical protein BDZ89DRAFT_953831, partial [Hymenopellis radicata]
QTIASVLADLAKPPSGRLSLFNMYVALSRSSGHDVELMQEDERLEMLNDDTKQRWLEITRTDE